MQDKLYDVIIIGASKEGINAYNSLKRSAPEKSVVVISREFSNVTARNSVLTADRVEKEVVYTSDRRGIMIAICQDDTRICGLCLIIATGTKPKKFSFKTNNVYYDVKEVKSRAKVSPILLVGQDDKAVRSAIELAGKFRKVYMCLETLELQCSDELKAKISELDNIAILPLCKVKNLINDKNGNLMKVQLSTLDEIECKYLFCSLGQVPDLKGIGEQMITTDKEGYIKINDDFETEVVPGVYAVGRCTTKSVQPRDASRLIAAYRKRFGGN